MASINPINVNSQGIGNSYGYGINAKPEDKKSSQAEEKAPVEQKTALPADDILNFMAQSAVAVAPTTTKAIDPSKYVDEASAQRIAGFMAQFEDVVAQNLAAISKEFPGMSESAKQNIALAQINQ